MMKGMNLTKILCQRFDSIIGNDLSEQGRRVIELRFFFRDEVCRYR